LLLVNAVIGRFRGEDRGGEWGAFAYKAKTQPLPPLFAVTRGLYLVQGTFLHLLFIIFRGFFIA